MTELGEEADRIRRWAWEDPAGRLSTAMSRMEDLAGLAAGDEQAMREVGDSTRMLSRLEGSLVHDVTGIFDQMSHQENG